MPKIKYHFNPHTLKYEKVIVGVKKKLLVVLGWVATASVFAAVIVWIAFNYLDSPREKQLNTNIDELVIQYELLQKRVDLAEEVLHDVQNRDDNVYRVIFEADPIPQTVREAGQGGINRYKELESLANGKLMITTAMKIDKLEKQLYIQSKSLDEVFSMAKNKTAMLASIPGIQPISNRDLAAIASGFGWRIHPIYKTSMMHTGMDFAAKIGTDIYATGNGVVASVEMNGRGYGNYVVINHGYGYQTLYGHMSKVLVVPGQKITRGDIIGLVGNTGSSTGPHCHYEVIKNGTKINPVNFFFNDLSPEQYQKVIEIANRQNQSFD